jgi:hypothetical protein
MNWLVIRENEKAHTNSVVESSRKTVPMKTFVTIFLTAVFVQGSFGQSSTDESLKTLCSDRIHQTYGVTIDSASNSLTSLLDAESRLSKCRRIKEMSGVELDYLKYTDTELGEILLRATECQRLNSAHGLKLDWQQLSFAKLNGADSRIYAAKRINGLYGSHVDWLDYDLPAIIDLEQRILTALPSWARPRSRPDSESVASIYHRLGFPAPESPESESALIATIPSRRTAPTLARTNRSYAPSNQPLLGYYWVFDNFRMDGTYVPGSYRTNRNSPFWNNWYSRTVYDPATGRVTTRYAPNYSTWNRSEGVRIR